jgi:hypothetical protein
MQINLLSEGVETYANAVNNKTMRAVNPDT